MNYGSILHCCQVTSDAVGFGFVLRGSCPTYVQAVDPMGPAAMAGLKVIFQLTMFILRKHAHAIYSNISQL